MKMIVPAALICAASCIAPAHAATSVIEFDEVFGLGGEGNPGNTVLTRYLGAGTRITAISAIMTLEVNDPGWLNEHSIRFGSTLQSWVDFYPTEGLEHPGTLEVNDALDLLDAGIDLMLEDDGILRIEFIDVWNPDPEPKGWWRNGTITIDYMAAEAVPEPATWGMMVLGFAAIGGAARYRRRSRNVRFA